MSEKEKNKLNISSDLSDIRSLIGEADGGGFTLDEILSEYGIPPQEEEVPAPAQDAGPDLPWPEAKRRERYRDNVVAFPGVKQEEEPEEEAYEEEECPGEPEEVTLEPEDDEPLDNVIEFPEEESVLGAFVRDLKDRADDYADRMFEESERMDTQERRRLEELIPGTDQEDEADDIRYVRRPRKQEPPPPDTPPHELARKYGKGLKGLRLRIIFLALVTLASFAPLLAPMLGLVWQHPFDQPQVQVAILAGLLGVGMVLSIDVLVEVVMRLGKLKCGMDTVTLLACCLTLSDAASLAVSGQSHRLPYCTVALSALLMTVHGEYHKRCALRLSCRTAAAAAQPYLVTLDEGKWNGKDTYTKWSGTPEGFGSQIQMDDGAQRIYKVVCPVLILACVLLSAIASVGVDKGENLLWCLSATFTAASAMGGTLAYGRPFHKIARRLAQSGAALAGWPGMAESRRGDRVLITDWDLFPPGFVELNGIKVFGDFSVERVVAYTATLIRDSGSGLEKLFHDLLRAQGGIFRRADRMACYDGGGLSAVIRGDQVLVGSAAFMNLMEIELPQGLNVKNAVFCAINGELAGIFALSYSLPDAVFPSLSALLGERVAPVLATRDFNVIPAMLRQRFKLAADKMDFPPIQRRRELSDPEQEHSNVLTAVLCREGLGPFADAVVGARRLRRCARVSALVSCFGSVLGILLSCYLTSVEAYLSLSPLNLLIYLVMWLLPVWFLTDWAPRY